ncbi:HAMP domain-containing sensor histidine kinase [Paenibacillus dokdonensis]|uniref:histidine kinase n=1 Tax=Paenibacillus dokdonensis TaxID=2567944 RepID=A0ABU6GQ47_9BACL|nr:HAMP domain-containing sensor histidine kinase [Paenibacillus dokdonensis]MEC0241830.1 HAMP domain-containing sensor histidine kinase [Paenibacillus dokdonensis]
MRVAFKTACMLVLVMIVLIVARPGSGFAAPGSDYISMSGWDFKWAQQKDAADLRANESPDAGWKRLNSLKNLPTRDQDTADAWYKTVLPELKSSPSALLLKKVYGQHIIIYLDQRKVYEQTRSYMYDVNKILLPLSPGDMGKTLRIQVQAEKDRIGIAGDVLTGDYQMLLKQFVKSNLDDLILGSSMVFVGMVMLIVALFMRKGQLISWLTLTLILLSIGAIILTYSPLLYSLYNSYGQTILIVFDVALLSLLPSLTFYFEKTVGAGYMQIIRHFRKFQTLYSLICLSFMVVNLLLNDRIFDLYYVLSVKILGYLIILQIILVVVSSIGYAVKGNRNALIFTSGFVVFGLTVLIEMISFIVSSGKYELYWWKWGVLGFVLALIAVLGQKFTENHRQILMYSKELEMFNMELQRSEKMEIISELAASVAHEVRNPLQVTRGFLQLLLEKSINKDREYLTLALKELDRASGIITDFLTFAKPEIDQVQLLELADEFRHIEGILIPLANFQGSKITSRIPKDLYIEGNSSKFKQAFINIIKNSIEALREEGQVHIWAYTEQDEVVIHIQDNGEGMEPSEVARLGEPYFSNKTKGTGLGLMVTFRIIEVMKGNMKFLSEKGVGTEVIVRFPAVIQEDPI